MSRELRVRFAPSPTGPLHIGGVRTALYNYLFARKNGGKFILRIEDTDQARYVEGAEKYIKDSLKWCGLEYDEGVDAGGENGPYRQSERKDIYRKYAFELVEKGHAYYAFDSSEELDEMRKRMTAQGDPSPKYNAITRQYMKNSLSLSSDEVQARLDKGDKFVIRIQVPRKEEIKFQDLIRGWVSFHSSQLDDKVIFKSDGMPTYHLANVVDDYLMRISHVIRGEEWLPSTPIHVLLYRFFGWEDQIPAFAHLPLILRPDGKGKLSKRDGDRLGFPVYSIDWQNPLTHDTASGFREKGFSPEAFLNMLAFLGWNPGTTQEIFTLKELIDSFSIERVGKAGARFDFEKAKWFNQQHLRATTDAELARQFIPILEAKGLKPDRLLVEKVCNMVKERATFLSDFWLLSYYFFQDVSEYDEKTVRKKWKEENRPFFEELSEILAATEPFDAHSLEIVIKEHMTSYNMGMGAVMPFLRIAFSGSLQGPPVFPMMEVLGRETCVKRLKKALNLFSELISA